MTFITRLAPSPTGALHLGNARTFLINWLLARQQGWNIVLRIEDLDGPRIKSGADRQLIEDLDWLGLDWDQGPVYQSARMDLYKPALDRLIESGQAYPCVCSRKEVEQAASAPHAEDGAVIYPGTCRNKYGSIAEAAEASGRAPAIRLAVPGRIIEFQDHFTGPQSYDAQKELGDFVIAKADGTPAYQLAVVVDDVEMKVDQVVRGRDLLDSTPRQMLLYHALGFPECIPNYYHLPLVVGTDGRRLAKRHGDTRLAFYRQRGVRPQQIIGLLARWSGISMHDSDPMPADLVAAFKLSNLPPGQTIFSTADDARLLEGTGT
jgi:glutamyl-tRNA synthetase